MKASKDTPMPTPLTTLAYDGLTGLMRSLTAGFDAIDFAPDYLGRQTGQILRMSGITERSVHTTVSPAGRHLAQRGADGTMRTFSYDGRGRCERIDDEHVTVVFEYDALSRLSSRTVTTPDGNMIATFTYDALGQLANQDWEFASATVTNRVALVLRWRADGKLDGRVCTDADGSCIRSEAFGYDARGRLVAHDIVQARDDAYPSDEMGRRYRCQTFDFDAIDNLTRVATTFLDGTINEATYRYADDEADRLTSIAETAGPGTALSYAVDGGIAELMDARGTQRFTYDGAGRMSTMTDANGSTSEYRYGPAHRVTGVLRDGTLTHRIFEEGRLGCTISTAAGTRRYVRARGALVAETVLSDPVVTTLVGSDPQGSVLVEDDEPPRGYGAYGTRAPNARKATTAFAGEVPDDGSQGYLLGHRLYLPALRRFASPDLFSPFDDGGLNRYAYCAGDPVGRIDPSGQSWLNIGLAIFGIATAALATIVSAGAALPAAVAAGSVWGAVSTPSVLALATVAAIDVVSLAAEAGSAIATIKGNDSLASIFGTIATVTGVLGAATGLASLGESIARAITRARPSVRFVGSTLTRGGKPAARASIADMALGGPGARPRGANPIRKLAELPPGRGTHSRHAAIRPDPGWYAQTNGPSTYWAADTELTVNLTMMRLRSIAAELPEGSETIYVYGGAHGWPTQEPRWDSYGLRNRPDDEVDAAYRERLPAVMRLFAAKGYDMRYVPLNKINADMYDGIAALPGIHVDGTCFGVADPRFRLASGMAPHPVYLSR